MKIFITSLIVLAFLGISIFGFSVLHNGMHGTGCLASTLGGGVCSTASDGFGFASFHLHAFKIFSNATFELALIALVLFLALGLILFLGRSNLLSPAGVKFILRDVSANGDELRFRHWLTLFEKRDPAPLL